MPIIALTLPELNRSSSVATMPSGSVGSEYDSDIRGLLLVLVELRCGDEKHLVANFLRSHLSLRWKYSALECPIVEMFLSDSAESDMNPAGDSDDLHPVVDARTQRRSTAHASHAKAAANSTIRPSLAFRSLRVLPLVTGALLLASLAIFSWAQLSFSAIAASVVIGMGCIAGLPLLATFQIYRSFDDTVAAMHLAKRTRALPLVQRVLLGLSITLSVAGAVHWAIFWTHHPLPNVPAGTAPFQTPFVCVLGDAEHSADCNILALRNTLVRSVIMVMLAAFSHYVALILRSFVVSRVRSDTDAAT
jgi:hypothetical protein